jgi:hypothetical protein
MPSDQAFRVSWQAGQLVVHAATEQRAIEIAVEYLRVPDAGRLSAKPTKEFVIQLQP